MGPLEIILSWAQAGLLAALVRELEAAVIE